MKSEWWKILRREASSHHMCEENRDALDSVDSKEDAIKLYKKTIDWALEEGYPSYNTLVKHFSDCEKYGVFVEKEFHGEMLNENEVYVFHNCRGTIRTGLNIGKKIIPMMYFANGCEMTLLGDDSGVSSLSVRVPLYVFGENKVRPDRDAEGVTWKVYRFDTK